MNRTGKIARLPHDVREELNRRLRDNVSGPKICQWLNGLPAAKAVCAEFAKRNGKKELPINAKHLSEWRRGGFQDWMKEQQMLTETREMARWSMQLAGSAGGQSDGGGDLSEGAAVLLSGQVLKVLAQLGNIQPAAPVANPSSKFQNPRGESGGGIRAASGDAVQDAEGCPEASAAIPLKRPEGRAPENEAEQMESNVRMLGALGRCVSGIRRGDQNRVRLAQRDKMIALERRKYDDERAEVRARKMAEEKQKKAEEKQKKEASRLSEFTKLGLVRTRLFGCPEKIIAEQNERIEQEKKKLAEFIKEAEARGFDCGGEKSSKFQIPSSKVVSASGAVVANGENGRNGGGAAVQQMAVNSGKSDQTENGANGREEAGLTQRREEAKAPGSEQFDRDELDRMHQQINRDLAETKAELIARGEYDPSLTPVTLPAKEEQEKFDLAEHFRRVRRLAEEVAANKAKVFASGRTSKGEGINN